MVRGNRPDPVTVHLESYAFKRGDNTVNAPLMHHMRVEHTRAWSRLSVGGTIGDAEDQHYMEHDRLVSEPEAIREIALERSVARHPAGNKRRSP